MRSNQGFASVIATFPQGSFATCRYPDTAEKQRKPYENTWSVAHAHAERTETLRPSWPPHPPLILPLSRCVRRHPEFVSKPPAENKWQEAEVAASGGPAPQLSHNTTGTKPLPIPFSQRPGYEAEQAAVAAAKRAAYEAFKAHQISSVGGDKIPDDFHDHTVYSEEHVRTELKKGQIFRPSKPRVGTTPLERANATNELAASQHLAVSAAAVQDREDREMQRRYDQRTQRQQQFQFRAGAGGMDRGMHMGGAGVRYVPAALDESRPQRTNGQQPAYYNVPERQQ